jgi:UDP-glucuronate 4-epimerase
MNRNSILVTGSAGFIGFHLVTRLISLGYQVLGLDSINNYYSTQLKFDRLRQNGIHPDKIVYNKIIRSSHSSYRFIQLKLEDKENMETLFAMERFDLVVHLAAQAGVRYSITHPDAYIDSNIHGFYNIIECCRHYPVTHLVYASSSSIYGLNSDLPMSTLQNTDHPVSLYAATKKTNELMAHVYSHLYKIPSTGLRFFTVYGPWGRPDMAFFSFTKAILENKPVKIFNNGQSLRDFTYVDDIVEGIIKVVPHPPGIQTTLPEMPDTSPGVPYKIYNIGNGRPVRLTDFINAIEKALQKKAIKEYLPEQPGDVPATLADITDWVNDFDFKPETPLQTGINRFVEWYKMYFKTENWYQKTVIHQ